MRNVYANTATVIGRGLRAAVVPGCLSATDPHFGTLASISPITAVPATRVLGAFTPQATNAMKPQGSHPPRATAALN